MRTFQKFQKNKSKSLLIEPQTINHKSMNYHKTEFTLKPVTKLYCPDCYNKKATRNTLPTQPNEPYQRRYIIKDEFNFQDNHKRENEAQIKLRIADREVKANEAFRSIDKFKNVDKEMLQHENEREANFFKATDHNRERAKNKSIKLESLINDHIDVFMPQENKNLNQYYEKCIGAGNNSSLIKSSSCPSLTKTQYGNSLKNQIALQERMKLQEKRMEKDSDRKNLNNLLNENAKVLKAKRDFESNMKQELAQQNEMIISLKMKKKKENKEDDLRKENEMLNNAQRNMNAYKLELSRKKNIMNNIWNYNRKMFLQEKEKFNKDRRDDIKYRNNGYIKDLLCEHGCQMVTCAECKKSFPKRVMTPIIIRKHN